MGSTVCMRVVVVFVVIAVVVVVDDVDDDDFYVDIATHLWVIICRCQPEHCQHSPFIAVVNSRLLATISFLCDTTSSRSTS